MHRDTVETAEPKSIAPAIDNALQKKLLDRWVELMSRHPEEELRNYSSKFKSHTKFVTKENESDSSLGFFTNGKFHLSKEFIAECLGKIREKEEFQNGRTVKIFSPAEEFTALAELIYPIVCHEIRHGIDKQGIAHATKNQKLSAGGVRENEVSAEISRSRALMQLDGESNLSFSKRELMRGPYIDSHDHVSLEIFTNRKFVENGLGDIKESVDRRYLKLASLTTDGGSSAVENYKKQIASLDQLEEDALKGIKEIKNADGSDLSQEEMLKLRKYFQSSKEFKKLHSTVGKLKKELEKREGWVLQDEPKAKIIEYFSKRFNGYSNEWYEGTYSKNLKAFLDGRNSFYEHLERGNTAAAVDQLLVVANIIERLPPAGSKHLIGFLAKYGEQLAQPLLERVNDLSNKISVFNGTSDFEDVNRHLQALRGWALIFACRDVTEADLSKQ